MAANPPLETGQSVGDRPGRRHACAGIGWTWIRCAPESWSSPSALPGVAPRRAMSRQGSRWATMRVGTEKRRGADPRRAGPPAPW